MYPVFFFKIIYCTKNQEEAGVTCSRKKLKYIDIFMPFPVLLRFISCHYLIKYEDVSYEHLVFVKDTKLVRSLIVLSITR